MACRGRVRGCPDLRNGGARRSRPAPRTDELRQTVHCGHREGSAHGKSASEIRDNARTIRRFVEEAEKVKVVIPMPLKTALAAFETATDVGVAFETVCQELIKFEHDFEARLARSTIFRMGSMTIKPESSAPRTRARISLVRYRGPRDRQRALHGQPILEGVESRRSRMY